MVGEALGKFSCVGLNDVDGARLGSLDGSFVGVIDGSDVGLDDGINEGCDLINDISAGQFDPELWKVLAAANTPYILTYNRAAQNNKAQSHLDNKGIISDALSFLSEKLVQLKLQGITDVGLRIEKVN